MSEGVKREEGDKDQTTWGMDVGNCTAERDGMRVQRWGFLDGGVDEGVMEDGDRYNRTWW